MMTRKIGEVRTKNIKPRISPRGYFFEMQRLRDFEICFCLAL